MTPDPPEPVKCFVAALWAEESALAEAKARLVSLLGPIDFEGPDRPFDRTDYYEAEMGPNLLRRLIGLEVMRDPGSLPALKLACIQIEESLSGPRGRLVNLDIGYLDHNKVVLGSIKASGQKIYLSDGVYADLVARYAEGRYQPFAWTFPDFRDGRYDAELGTLRAICQKQVKVWRRGQQTRKPRDGRVSGP